MKYTVIGAGRSGMAVARLLREEGESVFVSDAGMPESVEKESADLAGMGAEFEFGGHTARALDADVMVLSPGVPPNVPVVVAAEERGIRITNEIEIAAVRCRGTIVGVTGTNGKTTTTELIGHLCREGGRKTFVAGNVGTPFSAIVRDADEESVVALELSSFQLEKIETLHPHVSVLLNVTPDHLDRYAGFDDYAAAKIRIAMNQHRGDVLIYNDDDPAVTSGLARFGSRSLTTNGTGYHGSEVSGPLTLGFSIERELPRGAFARNGVMMVRLPDRNLEIAMIPLDDIGIRGPHNLANSMAATLAAICLELEIEDVRRGLKTFKALPHRLEDVGMIDGVRWINDSKGTNTDAARYALSSFSEPIIWIAGGRAKKNDYTALRDLVRTRVKAAVLIGEAADEMEREFGGMTKIERAGESMEEGVRRAAALATPGDVVLLSPACASFDMFKNYEHRGDVFRELVRKRAGAGGDDGREVVRYAI